MQTIKEILANKIAEVNSFIPSKSNIKDSLFDYIFAPNEEVGFCQIHQQSKSESGPDMFRCESCLQEKGQNPWQQ